MGLNNLKGIVSGLLGAGMPASMPVAVVQNGTLSTQRSVVSQLEHIVSDAAREKLASPALVIVGDVVKFASSQQAVEMAQALSRKRA
jgi:uroporphyrin-III C-methyltransferase